jgi:membrane protease YdiL (CAAX protease family)
VIEQERGPGAGWYPDPGGHHQQRYWDGRQWTAGVLDNGEVAEDALPPVEQARTPVGVRPPETRADLPARAVRVALAGLVLSLVLGGAGAAVAGALHLPRVGRLVVSQTGLWGGMLWAVWTVSRRFGTGSIRRDFAVRATALDAGRGFLYALGARFATVLVIVPLLLINRRLVGSNVAPIRRANASPALLAVLGVIMVVGAPIVEELFFRGLLLRSLSGWRGAGVAVPVQAVVFGTVHMHPVFGLRNGSVFLAITVVGVILGLLYERYRRLGPGMWTHAWFNAVVFLVLVLRH